MKYHNTSGRKRQTKKRGGTKSKNVKPKKVVKTLKQQSAQQAATRTQDNQHRKTAIINRIKQYNNDANHEQQIAEKFGVRALTSNENTRYTNEQFSDPNDSKYLNDTEFYELYNKHKKLIADQRRNNRDKVRENKRENNHKHKRENKRENKAKSSSPVASSSTFIGPDGNQSAYPFSNRTYDSEREIDILSGDMPNSPTTSPQNLFHDLNYFLKTPPKTPPKTSPKTPPKTPPINYGDEYDLIDGMFDTPKKNHPKV